MCGIAGIVETDREKPPAMEDLSGMLALLAHRGPDGQRSVPFSGACLGHRRLAIIDLSEAGIQPFHNEDRSIWCAVNGEIYNHRELRHDLEARGHRFLSRCDAEVVVHQYEEDGADLVAKLEGMFALAVWDERQRQLTLARDRMGEKPLFYSETAQRLLFASEVEALLAVDSVDRSPDEKAIHDFLTFRFVPSPATGFRGIRKVPPGHVLIWERGRSAVKRYWAPPAPGGIGQQGQAGGPRDGARGESAARLRSLLRASVARRLESDVPLGLLLSGGLDSSVLAFEMSRALGGGFDTFSVGFPGTSYDESQWAALVARHVGSRHHAIEVTPDVVATLPLLVRRYGEPFADSSAVAVEALARAVRPHVKVVLGGDGGDELFGGYDRYRALALSARIGSRAGASLARPIARALGALPVDKERRNLPGRALRFAAALAGDPLERNEAWSSCFTAAEKADLYTDEFAERAGGSDSLSLLRALYPQGDPVAAAIHADLLLALPDRMLFKVDGATMSVGLEARSPFLATALVEWASRLPSSAKVAGGRGKLLLREAYGPDLPPEILRRKKAGFGLPVDRWLRGPLREMTADLLGSNRFAERGIFRREPIAGMIGEHVSGRRNHDDRLWSLICLELWYRTFIDQRARLGDSPVTPPEDSYWDTDAPLSTMDRNGESGGPVDG